MKKAYAFLCHATLALLCLAFVSSAEAIRLETSRGIKNLTFGINGFLGFEYAYMDKMPMVMDVGGAETIGAMPGVSFLKLRHLNLLVSVEKENLRVLINLHSNNVNLAGSNEIHSRDTIETQEAYAEYIFRDFLRIRAGSFLAPFGIYNDVRYILPIFSSVVLPQIYDPPKNYSQAVKTGKTIETLSPLTPEDGNLMFWGRAVKQDIDFRYHLYLSNGTNQTGGREDSDIGFGGRILMNTRDVLKIGGSAYTVHNRGAAEGRARFFGGDVTFSPSSTFTLQGEYVVNRYSERRSRYSYYLQADFPRQQWLPYLRYDFLKDREHLLMKRGQERYTLGVAYRFKPNLQIKGGFHYHRIVDDAGLSSSLANFNMVRLALIATF